MTNNSNGFDNMKIRKTHLEKLDQFVKTLYDETQVFKQYMNVKDLEMLYLHIHEIIQEMLQCKTSDEFMAMLEQLHQSIAGVLIIISPGQASQVKQELQESYTDFKADSFDDLLNQLHKTATQKFGQKGQEKAKEMQEKMTQDFYDRKKEADKLIDQLDLENYIKEHPKPTQSSISHLTEATEKEKEKTKELKETDDFQDPFDSLWKNLRNQ